MTKKKVQQDSSVKRMRLNIELPTAVAKQLKIAAVMQEMTFSKFLVRVFADAGFK